MSELFFLDATCPKCGRTCGNGGSGTQLHCSCGWSGDTKETGICKEDMDLMNDFLRRARERDQAAIEADKQSDNL